MMLSGAEQPRPRPRRRRPAGAGRKPRRSAESIVAAAEAIAAAETFQNIAALQLRLGVHWRTLIRAFHRVRGAPPKAAIRRLLLKKVREQLEAGTGTVSDAAFGFGFTEQGRFAAQYRNEFGELPSQTLAIARAARAGRRPAAGRLSKEVSAT